MDELRKQLKIWSNVNNNESEYLSWRAITEMLIEKEFGIDSPEHKTFNRILVFSGEESRKHSKEEDKRILEGIINSFNSRAYNKSALEMKKIYYSSDSLVEKLITKTIESENSFEINNLVNTIAAYIKIKSDNQLFDHTIEMRKSFSEKIIWGFLIFSVLAYLLIGLNYVCGLNISENILLALIAQIPIQLIGVLYLIAKNLFPKKSIDKEIDD